MPKKEPTGDECESLKLENSVLRREIERLKSEEERRRIESALNSPFDPVLLVSEELEIIEVNAAGRKAWGLESRVDRAGAEPYLLPASPEAGLEEMIAQCMQGRPQRYSGWFDIPGIGRSYREVDLQPFYNSDGAGCGVLAASRDRTFSHNAANALKHAEDRFRDLYENAPVGLAQVTPEGVLLNANPALAKICGYSSSETLLQEASDIVKKLLARKSDWRRLRLMTSRKRSTVGAELKIRRRDGEEIWVEVHLRVVRDDNGKLVCYDAFIVDADRRKKAEAAMEEAVEKARHASMAKGNFLAHMSHEVRTPLSAIIGLTELTLETELDDDQRMCLEMIMESSRSLLSILNDVLDLSKIEAGKLEFAEDVFNVRSLAESCVKMFSRSAEQRGIELIIDRSDNLPELAVGDPDRLRQVLVNLLSNAVKFTTRGFVKLSAAAEEHDKPGELKIRFSVLDTGKGIPPAMQKNVFETFVQAGRSFEGGSRGFGLGLAISDNLVKLMGGRLELESREGQGSEFSFSAVFKAPAAMEARRRAREIPELKRGLKVLVAEDEDTNADFVCRLLAKYGHKPERAQNGAEVLNMLGRGGYDLVLMDIQMPEMDGMEAASRIRSGEDGIDPHIPIIALTAHAMRGDKETFLAAGMDGYVPKPVDSSELLAAMTEVMGADEG